jgi:SHS2 domain-containing protein
MMYTIKEIELARGGASRMITQRGKAGETRRFRTLEHEADTGVEIYGIRYEDLFVNGAYALFSLMCDLRKVRRKEKMHFCIPGDEDALVHFLNELLYRWDVNRFIPKRTSVTREGGRWLVAMEGETFDAERHVIRKLVKAATYHGFVIEWRDGGVTARVILDI